MRERDERDERWEIGQDSSEAKAGLVKEKWNVFFLFFFVEKRERERESVCVCVCVCEVWLVMICSGPLYLIFFDLFYFFEFFEFSFFDLIFFSFWLWTVKRYMTKRYVIWYHKVCGYNDIRTHRHGVNMRIRLVK